MARRCGSRTDTTAPWTSSILRQASSSRPSPPAPTPTDSCTGPNPADTASATTETCAELLALRAPRRANQCRHGTPGPDHPGHPADRLLDPRTHLHEGP